MILIVKVLAFGYVSNGEVKVQFNKCMMNGEFVEVCDYLCSQVSDADDIEIKEDEGILEQQCDKCRG